jgi:L-ascorbate metabolism protein UlaG (beta-lactamase superfamily)
MRKWLKRFGVLIGVVFAGLVGAAFWSDSDTAEVTRFTSDPGSETVRAGWRGTPVDQRGRFVNDEFPFLPKTRDLLRWQLSSNPFEEEKENDNFRPEVKDPSEFLASGDDGILWLGHASFYIRLAGKGILIDPVFGEPRFIRRLTEVPDPLEMLPRVDFVLTSHDHRDHADENTLRRIAERFPDAAFLAGLGAEDILGEWTGDGARVVTTGWFQRFAIQTNDVEIYFMPVRHWSRRGLFDTNRRLWGGFVIRGGGKAIYHGGDSGYGRHYRETGELFSDIDYFLIAIGSYEPRWFMEPNHTNPDDAVRAFKDIGAKWLVPMHYATFDLSDEPPGKPLRDLEDAAASAGVSEKVRVVAIYESIVF